jgi:addiction module HigA family antidote
MPLHPGVVLLRHLKPFEITQTSLAHACGVRLRTINRLVHGKTGITPAMAWKLGAILGTSPEYWMTLQMTYSLARSRPSTRPPIHWLLRANRQLPTEHSLNESTPAAG